MSKYKDTDQEAFVRIRDAMIDWRDSTIHFAAVVAEAKEREIWKLKKYDTFEDFCQIECGITRQWANKLVLANKIMLQIANFEPPKPLQINKNVETAVSKTPVSIDAAIQLAKVPESDRQTVLQQATATGQPLTAKTIAQAADQTLKVADKMVRRDHIAAKGREIPAAILSTWDRADAEVTEILRMTASLLRTLRAARERNDVIYAEVNLDECITKRLEVLQAAMKRAIPWAICSTCQGKLPENCGLCKGRGYLSQFLWDCTLAKEHKDVILKGIK